MAIATGIEAVLEKLVKNYYDNYQDLIMDISEINSPIINFAINSVYDPNDMSYSAVNRADKAKANQSKYIKKNAIYGVVLRVIDNKGIFTGKTVYVDVPPYNKKLIFHPNNFPQAGAKELEDFEDLIFEIQGVDLFTSIKQGDIVEVEIPENYPNHVLSNKSDAVIKKVIYDKTSIKPNENSKKVETNNGSGLNAQNGPSQVTPPAAAAVSPVATTPTGGNIPALPAAVANVDIGDSWALTKLGIAPPNLAALEKKEIEQTKQNFKKIIQNKLMEPHNKIIVEAAREIGVNPTYIRSLIAIESLFNQNAFNSASGAGGLMQLTGIAIKDITLKGSRGYKQFIKHFPNEKVMARQQFESDVKNGKKIKKIVEANYSVEQNIWIGTISYSFWLNSLKNPIKAAGAYNNGAGAVPLNRGIKIWNFDEITEEATHYVFRFNTYCRLMSNHFGTPIPGFGV